MENCRASAELVVFNQMCPENMVDAANQEFSAVICNRPDGEEEWRTRNTDMRDAAQTVGLAIHHIPIVADVFPSRAAYSYCGVWRGSDGLAIAYCRTRTKFVALETHANPEGVEPPERNMLAVLAAISQ